MSHEGTPEVAEAAAADAPGEKREAEHPIPASPAPDVRKAARRYADLDADEKVDVLVKIGTLAALATAGLWTLYLYSAHSREMMQEAETRRTQESEHRKAELELRNQELRLKRIDLNQRFWQQRAETCREIAVTAANLAIGQGRDPATETKFEALYWGAAPIIETPQMPDRGSLEGALQTYETQRRACHAHGSAKCWEDLLVCSTDVAYECARLICNYLDDPQSVDICSAARQPQCGIVTEK